MSASLFRTSPSALAAALLLALGLSACSPAPEEPSATAAPAAPAPATEPGAEAAQAVSSSVEALAALSVDELRENARAALRDQRLYSPAGENAMEYYLALRDKSSTPNVAAESALIDLMPYALIGAEQAILESDFTEAERLLELMRRTDSEAPSLGRIGDAIASGRTGVVERERLQQERAERDRLAAAERARTEAVAAAAAPPAAAAPIPSPIPAPAEPTPAPVEPIPAPVAAAPVTPAPIATPVRTGAPVPISTPQPPYPREAARSRASGSVTVQFTIGADGRVSNVQVMRARPRGLFEETVESTVSTWRFEPPGEAVTQTRTFDFRM